MATQEVIRPVFLPVIIGTPRQGRLTEPAANFVFGEVSKRSDIETELTDIRKIPIRMDDAGEALKDSEFSVTVDRADGLILVVPEYQIVLFEPHGEPVRRAPVGHELAAVFLGEVREIRGVTAV